MGERNIFGKLLTSFQYLQFQGKEKNHYGPLADLLFSNQPKHIVYKKN